MVQVGRHSAARPLAARLAKCLLLGVKGAVSAAHVRRCLWCLRSFFQISRLIDHRTSTTRSQRCRLKSESPLLLRAGHTTNSSLFSSTLWRGVVRESRAPRLTRRLAPVASRCPASDRPSGQSTRASKPPPRWTSSDGSACAGSTTPRWCGLRRASSPAGGPRCPCPRCSRGCSCPARRTSPWAAGVRPDHDP